MDHTDHSEATHEMTCPMEGCDYHMEVHAHDDDEAVKMFVEQGKDHMMEVHADAMSSMSPEDMEKTVRGAMKQKEA